MPTQFFYISFHIITGRNEVLAKVIFSQASVCPQRGWWMGLVLGGGGLQFFGGVSPIFAGVSNFSGGGLQPEYGQRSAGTHPTGMHSCFSMIFITFFKIP